MSGGIPSPPIALVGLSERNPVRISSEVISIEESELVGEIDRSKEGSAERTVKTELKN